jgi:hypothetical protein
MIVWKELMTIEITDEDRSFMLMALGFVIGATIERKDEELIAYFLKQSESLRQKLAKPQ